VSAKTARKVKRRSSTTRSSPRLTREIGLRTGLEIANEQGIDAATLAGMLELVVRDAAVTDHDEEDWRDWTSQTFTRMAEAMLAQQGVMTLLSRVGSLAAATVPVLEEILSRLCAVGFSPSEAVHLEQDLSRFMLGTVAIHSLRGIRPSDADGERHVRARFELLPSSEFPRLTRSAAEIAHSMTHPDYESGFRRIIDSHAESLANRHQASGTPVD
jgi:hypothetical protein